MRVDFFVYSYGAHRPLHSFPTRRSSDLRRRSPPRPCGCGATLPVGRGSASLPRRQSGTHTPNLYRSEEHTSELQSLRHLVCRLLLEKKKTSTTSGTTLTAAPREATSEVA